MAISVRNICANLVMVVGRADELITGDITETAIGAADIKLAVYGGNASEPFKAIIQRYQDRLMPIGAFQHMVRGSTSSTCPLQIVNLPSTRPFTDAHAHNKFQYIAQAIANKPKYTNNIYIVFLNLGGPTRGN